MRYSFLIALLVLALSPAMAGVYKSIGPDGRIQYTDRPISGAKEVSVPKTAPPAAEEAAKESDEPGEPAQAQGAAEADAGPYEAFEIASPEADATFRDENGSVPMSLTLIPSLRAEHRLRVIIDSRPLPGDVPGTQLVLNGLSLGTHSLQAQIIDDFDEPIASTATISFHMRKPVPEAELP